MAGRFHGHAWYPSPASGLLPESDLSPAAWIGPFYWAYIAGSAECVSEVLSVPELDACETTPGNPARSGMDVINDPHGTIARYTLTEDSTAAEPGSTGIPRPARVI